MGRKKPNHFIQDTDVSLTSHPELSDMGPFTLSTSIYFNLIQLWPLSSLLFPNPPPSRSPSGDVKPQFNKPILKPAVPDHSLKHSIIQGFWNCPNQINHLRSVHVNLSDNCQNHWSFFTAIHSDFSFLDARAVFQHMILSHCQQSSCHSHTFFCERVTLQW